MNEVDKCLGNARQLINLLSTDSKRSTDELLSMVKIKTDSLIKLIERKNDELSLKEIDLLLNLLVEAISEKSSRHKIALCVIQSLWDHVSRSESESVLVFLEEFFFKIKTESNEESVHLRQSLKSVFIGLIKAIIARVQSIEDSKEGRTEEPINCSSWERFVEQKHPENVQSISTQTVQIKNTILPKLDIGFVTGSVNFALASRSSRRQNLSSVSLLNSPNSNRLSKLRMKAFAESLGQNAVCADLTYLMHSNREARFGKEMAARVAKSSGNQHKVSQSSEQNHHNGVQFDQQKSVAFEQSGCRVGFSSEVHDHREQSMKKVTSGLRLQTEVDKPSGVTDFETKGVRVNTNDDYRMSKLNSSTVDFEFKRRQKDGLKKLMGASSQKCLSKPRSGLIKEWGVRNKSSVRLIALNDRSKLPLNKGRCNANGKSPVKLKRSNHVENNNCSKKSINFDSFAPSFHRVALVVSKQLRKQLSKKAKMNKSSHKNDIKLMGNNKVLMTEGSSKGVARHSAQFHCKSHCVLPKEDSFVVANSVVVSKGDTHPPKGGCSQLLSKAKTRCGESTYSPLSIMLQLFKLIRPLFQDQVQFFDKVLLKEVLLKDIPKRLASDILHMARNDEYIKAKMRSMLNGPKVPANVFKRLLFVANYTLMARPSSFIESFGEEVLLLKEHAFSQSEDTSVVLKMLPFIKSLSLHLPQHTLFVSKAFFADPNVFQSIESCLSKVLEFKLSKREFAHVNCIVDFVSSALQSCSKPFRNTLKRLSSRLFSVKMGRECENDRYLLSEYFTHLCRNTTASEDTKKIIFCFSVLFKKAFPKVTESATFCHYVRSVYFEFLVQYCSSNRPSNDHFALNVSLDVLIMMAENKHNKHAQSVLKQLKTLLFLSKEIDLEFEFPFIVSRYLDVASECESVVSESVEFTGTRQSLMKPVVPKLNLRSIKSTDALRANQVNHREGLAQPIGQAEVRSGLCGETGTTGGLIGKTQEVVEQKEHVGRKGERCTPDASGNQFGGKSSGEQCSAQIVVQSDKNQGVSGELLIGKRDPDDVSEVEIEELSVEKDKHKKSRSLSLDSQCSPLNLATLAGCLFKPGAPVSSPKAKLAHLRPPSNRPSTDPRLFTLSFHKRFRRVYSSVDCQKRIVRLVMTLLLSKSLTSLNEEYTGHYPLQNGKSHHLFVLQRHLSDQSNQHIARSLFYELTTELSLNQRRLSNAGVKFNQNRLFLAKCVTSFEIDLQDRDFNNEENDEELTDNCPDNQPPPEGTTGRDDFRKRFSLSLSEALVCLLKCLTPNFAHKIDFIEKLGCGAFSVVKRGCVLGDDSFAVKLVSADRSVYDRNSLFYLFNELRTLGNLKHLAIPEKEDNHEPEFPNLIDFGLTTEGHYGLLLPCYNQRLKTAGNLKRTLRAFHEIAQNVKKLHANGVVHFDIKCDNVLRGQRQHLLVDFGESLHMEQSLRLRGTELIRSPEMVNSRLEEFESCNLKSGFDFKDLVGLYNRQSKFNNGPACDVWALGCLLYELYTGEMLFLEKDWTVFYNRLVSDEAPLLSPDNLFKLKNNLILVTLLNYILCRNPQQRPSVASIIKKIKGACTLLNIELHQDPHEPIPCLTTPEKNNSNTGFSSAFVDFLPQVLQKTEGFWLNQYILVETHPVNESIEQSMHTSNERFDVFDFSETENSILQGFSTSSSTKKLSESLLESICKVRNVLPVLKTLRKFIVIRSRLSKFTLALAPLLLAVEEQTLSTCTFVRIQALSFYSVMYTCDFLSLIVDLWKSISSKLSDVLSKTTVHCFCGAVVGKIDSAKAIKLQKSERDKDSDVENSDAALASLMTHYKRYFVESQSYDLCDFTWVDFPLSCFDQVVETNEPPNGDQKVKERHPGKWMASKRSISDDSQMIFCSNCDLILAMKCFSKNKVRMMKSICKT